MEVVNLGGECSYFIRLIALPLPICYMKNCILIQTHTHTSARDCAELMVLMDVVLFFYFHICLK